MNNRLKKVNYIFWTISIILSILCIITHILNWYNTKSQSNLLNEIIIDENAYTNKLSEDVHLNELLENISSNDETQEEKEITERMLKVQELKNTNIDNCYFEDIEVK